jgi:hypothetical protein
MSEQETLRLVAEVVDKYSGPLKQMMEQLKKIGDSGEQVHKKGVKQTQEHEKAYRELREQLKSVRDVATDTVRPAFSALGVTVLSVAGSIAAVSEAVKSFGEYGQKLEFAHRASGLLTSTVRGLAEANQRYGVSAEETVKALEQFGGHMDELARKSPNYINAWRAVGKNAWDYLGSDLMKLKGHREDQLKRAMEVIPTIRDVDQRKRVLALLGLPENWAYLSTKEMEAMRQKAAEFNRDFPFSEDAAKKANDAWQNLLSTMRGIKDEMSGQFAPGITDSLKGINDFLKSDDWKEFKTDMGKIGDLFSGWKLSDAFKSDIKDLKAIVHFLSNWLPHRDTDQKGLDEFKKQLQEENGRFVPSSYNRRSQDNIREGVREGMQDFYNSLKASGGGGGAGGFTNASFNPNGGSPFETRPGGGAAPRFGSKDFPRLDDNGGATGAAGGPGSIGSGDPASSLAAQRRSLWKETDASTRHLVNQMLATEGGGTATMEALFNRTAMIRQKIPGYSLRDELRSGFYGPINSGKAQRTAISEAMARRYQNQIDRALSGSNLIQGRTDQGTYGDPNANGPGRVSYPGMSRSEIYNFWRGHRGPRRGGYDFNYRDTASWAEHVNALANQSAGAHLSDMIRRGRRGPNDAELLRRGTGHQSSLNGNAHLTVDLNGFPKGTKTGVKSDGIFKQVTLNRGRPMTLGSELS